MSTLPARQSDSLVQNCLVGLDDVVDPFVHRFQTTVGDDDCNLDNLVLESIEAGHFTIDLGFSLGSSSSAQHRKVLVAIAYPDQWTVIVF